MRILKWIVERARGRAISIESPIGWMPRYEDLDWRGMEDFTRQRFSELMAVDRDLWQQELLSHEALFMNLFYPPYPPPFRHFIGHLMTLTQP